MDDNQYAPPSRNPADSDSLTGLLKLAFTKFLQKTDDMLPAEVISYNSATNMAEIQPLICIVSTANQQIQRPPIASVPVYQLSAGGFIVRFPVNKGDLGWIKANDRDISIFKQTLESSSPNTQRKHSFEDALFYPQAAFDLVTINSEDANNLVLQNYAGTVRIALWADRVKITAPQVIFDTPIATFTGVIDVQNSGSVSVPCTIEGAIGATGDIHAGVGGANVSLLTHVHGGVTPGGGDTGGPV